MTHYDVIIIGTGAGGGTLAYRLAPSGKRILLLERGDYVPREKDNWSSRAVNVEAKYHTQEVVARHATAGRSTRTRTTTSAATRNSTARRCSACASRTSASCAPRRRLAGVADRLRRSRAVLHRGRAPLSGARRARRRSDRALGERARTGSRPCSHEPRIQQLHDDLARRGLRPFHVPLGIMLDEQHPQHEPLHPLRHLRRLSLPGAREERRAGRLRRPGARAPERHAADRRQRDAARDQRVRPRGHRRRRRAQRRRASVFSARHRRRRRAARSIRRRCCCARPTTGIRTASPTARTSSAGTTWATSTRCCSRSRRRRTRPCSRRRWRSTTSTSATRSSRIPMGHISFVGKLDAVALSAGAPPFVPGMTLDLMAKHSLDFWLTSEDLPDPDNRVTLDRDGNIVLCYTPNNDEGHKRLIAQLEGPAAAPRHAPAPDAAEPVRRPAHPAGRRRAPERHDPLRPRPATSALDVNCKAHDWTTSTSSTAASSRRAAR